MGASQGAWHSPGWGSGEKGDNVLFRVAMIREKRALIFFLRGELSCSYRGRVAEKLVDSGELGGSLR